MEEYSSEEVYSLCFPTVRRERRLTRLLFTSEEVFLLLRKRRLLSTDFSSLLSTTIERRLIRILLK